MAVTYTVQEDAGVPTDLGRNGFVRIRYADSVGNATSKATTLSSTCSIKTIYGVIGGSYHDVPVTGVAGTTGFTLTFAAMSTGTLEVLVYGSGR